MLGLPRRENVSEKLTLRSFTAAGLSGIRTRFPFHSAPRRAGGEPNLRAKITEIGKNDRSVPFFLLRGGGLCSRRRWRRICVRGHNVLPLGAISLRDFSS